MTTIVRRPAVPGTVLAVAAGVVAVAVLLDTAAQWRALGLELAGLALGGAGYAAWRRGSPLPGALAGLVGGLLVAAGVAAAVTEPSRMTHRIELLPGLLGLAVVAVALLPVREGWERGLLTVGAALLFVGVVASGVVRSAPLLRLLVAGVATVVAWDAAEQAVSLGRQVGRGAETTRAVAVHAVGTVAAGAGVIAAALAVYRFDVEGLSLTAFVLLLVACFVLTLSLRH